MDNRITSSISVRGVDGNDLRFSETIERKEIVVSIQQNDDGGRLATVLLNKEQFDAIIEAMDRVEVEP